MTQSKNEWGAELITCHESSNSRGVTIMIKIGLDCRIHHTILQPMGRYMVLKADINDSTYVLINVYAPNKDKDRIEFVNNLLTTFKKENLDSEEKIIMGVILTAPLIQHLTKKEALKVFKNWLWLALTVYKMNLIWYIFGESKTLI